MAQSVAQRAAKRGFPVFSASGQSGQGALQDSTALPPAAGLPTATWVNPVNDPGSVPAALPPPEEYSLGLTLWGLSGASNPDNNPKSAPAPGLRDLGYPEGNTHAAPFADPSLPIGEYFAEADAAHADVFTGPAVRHDIGTVTRFGLQRSLTEGNGPLTQQKLTGPIRANAGKDGVQGYGGGGPGPGGTNLPELTVEERDYPGETYTTFVSAAEVPFLTADAVQFIAYAPELPPFTGVYNAPTADVSAQDTTATDTPAQGPALAPAPGYSYVPGFWG